MCMKYICLELQLRAHHFKKQEYLNLKHIKVRLWLKKKKRKFPEFVLDCKAGIIKDYKTLPRFNRELSRMITTAIIPKAVDIIYSLIQNVKDKIKFSIVLVVQLFKSLNIDFIRIEVSLIYKTTYLRIRTI